MPEKPYASENWQYSANKEIPPGEQLSPGVSRIALGVEYDGSPFCGWQKQHHSPSVQQPLEDALSAVADEPVKLVCAGRTDTGVHGCGQVVHFDTHAKRSEWNWIMGVNSSIHPAISLTWARHVDAQFHARFSAISRTYRYIILNAPYKPALLNKGVTWVRGPLDEKSMDRALARLQGTQDFSSYRGAGCQARSPVRTIEHSRVVRQGNLVLVEIRANAFLLHMVRNIVGQLLEVGRGNTLEDEMIRVLKLKDRTKAAVTAPPYGLYFVKATYPEHFGLPELPLGPYFLSAI